MFSRFYNCVNGVAHELPCPTSLVFDEAKGICVPPEQASEYAKKCNVPDKKRKNFTYINFLCCFKSLNYLTIDHWHLILQKSYPFSSNCRILMSRSECRRTKWSSSCPSKLSSSSQLPKIHHLLLLNRHQGVGLPEGSNFQSQYLWMCHPWRWTRRLVWVVSIYNLNHLNWTYLTQLNNI